MGICKLDHWEQLVGEYASLLEDAWLNVEEPAAPKRKGCLWIDHRNQRRSGRD